MDLRISQEGAPMALLTRTVPGGLRSPREGSSCRHQGPPSPSSPSKPADVVPSATVVPSGQERLTLSSQRSTYTRLCLKATKPSKVVASQVHEVIKRTRECKF